MIFSKFPTALFSALIAVCALPAYVSYASPSSKFPKFPEGCARAADMNLKMDTGETIHSVWVVGDGGDWKSATDKMESLHSKLMEPAANELLAAEQQTHKLRFSNNQSKIAGELLRKFELNGVYGRPPLDNIGEFTDSTDVIQFKCITATCPSGATCIALPIRQYGESYKSKLRVFRQLFNEAMSWMGGVDKLKAKVPSYIQHFNTTEQEIIAAIPDLPEKLYVIDAYVPRT